MSDRVFNRSQPIVFPDGTMQYSFSEFVREVDTAVTAAELVSVWGGVSGDITNQTDLVSGGKFLDSLVGESNVTQHEGALSIATSQLTGTLPDARVAESNVTQHEAALSIASSQLTGTLPDARVAQSNVTQHQAALSIFGLQVTSAVRPEATTPYTLQITDANAILRFTANNAAVTVPQESSVDFDIGTTVTLRQAGTGTLSLTTTGLTINGTLPSWAQHVEVTLRKVGADEWDVV